MFQGSGMCLLGFAPPGAALWPARLSLLGLLCQWLRCQVGHGAVWPCCDGPRPGSLCLSLPSCCGPELPSLPREPLLVTAAPSLPRCAQGLLCFRKPRAGMWAGVAGNGTKPALSLPPRGLVGGLWTSLGPA